VSDQTPPPPGGLSVGSFIAGYRLEEQIGRGGMAVVYRAHDPHLDRRVALKILAPELARDEEFRQRFIRESRAAAAVDHPNIIPIYDAGEADGILFIAMRFVEGRDVQTLIDSPDPLPTARVCDIVTQVASALDSAHAHGLVHRDVKPGNMLREATSGQAHPDHVYLSDFGLSKHSLPGAAALTSTGQFLGTLNYVAPEQIEGGTVDGRTDEYALACSAFEMLAGEPPFRRSETLAIMWAQLSAAPPSLTSIRPDLPPAVDEVMGKALAKSRDDRYGTCLEFSAALRWSCGLWREDSNPGTSVPGRGATRAVHPGELAAAAGAAGAAAGAADVAGQPPAPPTRPDQAGADQPVSGQAGTGQADTDPRGIGPPVAREPVAGHSDTGQADTDPGRPGWAGDAGPPTRQAAPVGAPGPARAGTTDPLMDYGHLYRSPGAPKTLPPVPPRRKSRRTLAAVAVGCIVLLGAGGAYVALTHGGTTTTGGGQTTPGTTRVLALPGCTTQTARTAPMPNVHTHFVQVGGSPFDVVVAPNGFGFVSLRKGNPLDVMNTAHTVPTVVNQVPLPNPEGEAFTHNGKYLLVAGGSGMTVFNVSDLEAGQTTPLGSLSVPGGKGAIEVVPSPDDRYAFVTLQNSGTVAVFNLHKALTSSFSSADVVGTIPMKADPLGITASPNGRYLYVVSGLSSSAINSGMGTLAIVNMSKAEVNPASSVVATDNAGCGPARVITSANGNYVWVTSGGGNALEAFAADKLISDPTHALVAKVAVGEIPLGLTFIKNGTQIVVADSNRDKINNVVPDLAVVDVAKALAGKPALLGTIKTGLAPRQFALARNGKTLLITNTGSGTVESVDVGQIH
jgi:6-phosphogluconolactonase (cycloisomerase 2 family)/tRNA A-37 threonylcarbamoyl transferase component Bud32